MNEWDPRPSVPGSPNEEQVSAGEIRAWSNQRMHLIDGRKSSDSPMKANLCPQRARYDHRHAGHRLAYNLLCERVAISVAAGPIARDLHIPKEQMGLDLRSLRIVLRIVRIPTGPLGDRRGVRRVPARSSRMVGLLTAPPGAAWTSCRCT